MSRDSAFYTLKSPFKIGRAPARAAESPKLSLPGAAPGRLAILHFGFVSDFELRISDFYLGSWQTRNALALQAS